MRNKRSLFSLYSILFVAFLLLPSFAFAGFDSSFKQSSIGILVNLSDTSYWRHSDNASWAEGESGNIPNPNYYYDNQILCSVEMNKNEEVNGNDDVELSAELLSSEWCYVLNGNDTKFKRPFAIQIMARGRNGAGSYTNIGNAISLGGTVASTAGTMMIPAPVASSFSELVYDVVLVFDDKVDIENDTVVDADGANTYSLLPSDSYYSATIRLSVRCAGEISSFDVYLNGFYSDEESLSSNTLMGSVNITKTTAENTIVAKDVFAGKQTVDIANYNYSTNSIQNKRSGAILISLSSAGYGNAGPFYLRHVNATGGTASRVTSHNSMMFYAYLTTDTGYSSKDPLNKTVMFDGNQSFPFDKEADYIIIPATTRMNKSGTKTLTSWSDSGLISFSIPEIQMINNDFVSYDGLVSGKYTANIYFNIISDF